MTDAEVGLELFLRAGQEKDRLAERGELTAQALHARLPDLLLQIDPALDDADMERVGRIMAEFVRHVRAYAVGMGAGRGGLA